MNRQEPIALFWFRRDLRLEDNAGLYHALQSGYRVMALFIYDINILDKLDNRTDHRVSFIHGALGELQKKFTAAGSSLVVLHDTPENAFKNLLSEFNVKAVYANHDYEPYAVSRDCHIAEVLKDSGILFSTFKDQVIFEKDEVLKPDKKPYTVFTPYSRRWKKTLSKECLQEWPSQELAGNFVPITSQLLSSQEPTGSFVQINTRPLPSLTDLGFHETGFVDTNPVVDNDIIRNYHLTRDIPSLKGTTQLGIHLRFGTVSIRQLVTTALSLNEIWLNELIWREFFMSIMWHFPYVIDSSFRKKYDNILWRNNEEEFDRWCQGMTGYPIVDAGMRELKATGFMHNRVRMITAGFLTKHLLIDWRWGEAWFASLLLDYELSSNNGNWQWAAGTGCDAAPYFRVFSPDAQTQKFDPDMAYIRTWIPEIDTPHYPQRMVDHDLARKRAVEKYKEGLSKSF